MSSSVDQTQIDRINEQLRQLAAQSNGLITINEKVVVANDDTIKDFAANADKVEASLKAIRKLLIPMRVKRLYMVVTLTGR